jgi:activator of HSP90 ATPase
MGSDNKLVGSIEDVGYQVDVWRTIEVQHSKVRDFVFSNQGLNLWLGPTAVFELEEGQKFELEDGVIWEVRVSSPGSHIRLTWQPGHYPRPSTI